MKLLPKILLVSFLLVLSAQSTIINPDKVYAAATTLDMCGMDLILDDAVIYTDLEDSETFIFHPNGKLNPDEEYHLEWQVISNQDSLPIPNPTQTFSGEITTTFNAYFDSSVTIRVERNVGGIDAVVCEVKSAILLTDKPNEEFSSCDELEITPYPPDVVDTIFLSVPGLPPNSDSYTVNVKQGLLYEQIYREQSANSQGVLTTTLSPIPNVGPATIEVRKWTSLVNFDVVCSAIFDVEEFNENTGSSGDISRTKAFDLCNTVTSDTDKNTCEQCLRVDGVWTGLGCLKIDPKGFVQNLLTLAIGLGGGIAFLLIIYGSFVLTTAAGVPDNIQKGREIIGGAVAGLLFIIFSVVLLNLIGVQILQIPGL